MQVSDSDEEVNSSAFIIYKKIDLNGVGYIDRAMLRDYCKRVLSAVSPGKPVDAAALENGFRVLDADGDGRITL